MVLVTIFFGVTENVKSFPRVASKPPDFRSGASVTVIISLAIFLFVKATVPVPLAEIRVVKAGMPHFGVEKIEPTVKSAATFSLQEMSRFAPFDFSVTHENEIGTPSGMRSVVVEVLNEMVTGSGTMLLSTETETDFVCIPL